MSVSIVRRLPLFVVLAMLIAAPVAQDRPGGVRDMPDALDRPRVVPMPWEAITGGTEPPPDARAICALCSGGGRDDLSALVACSQLVSLHIELPPGSVEWVVPADFFQPIAKLAALEELSMIVAPRLDATVLRRLRQAPKLRCLTLTLMRPFTIADVTALQEIVGLVSLRIEGTVLGDGGRIDRSAMRALGLLPRLQSLTISNLAGCSEPVLEELSNLRGLRRLELQRLGRQPAAVRLGRLPAAGTASVTGPATGAAAAPDSEVEAVHEERRRAIQATVGLTPAVAEALGELPRLDDLRLETCAVSGAAVAALPIGLTAISIRACPDADAAVYAGLERLSGLHRVWFGRTPFSRNGWPTPVEPGDEARFGMPDQRAVARAQAKLLRALPIESFGHVGSFLSELAAVLPTVETIRAVQLIDGAPWDYEVVARMPGLATLTLESGGLQAKDLEPLRDAAKLAELRLASWTVDDGVAAFETVLPGVTIRVE